MNDELSGLFDKTITLRAPDGHALIETKAIHAAAVGIAGIIMAPRVAAAAAIAALIAGVTVSVAPDPETPAA